MAVEKAPLRQHEGATAGGGHDRREGAVPQHIGEPVDVLPPQSVLQRLGAGAGPQAGHDQHVEVGAALTIDPAAHGGGEAVPRDHRVGTADDLDVDAGDLDVEGPAQSLGRLQHVEQRRQARGEAPIDRSDGNPHVANGTEVVRNAAHSVAIRADLAAVA